jgi:hypothetical protein
MFRGVAYWCIMMLSAVCVLMPSVIETLLNVDELPSFLPLCGLIVSAISMWYRVLFGLWRAGHGSTTTTTAHQDHEIDVKRLSLTGGYPPVPKER